MGLKLLGFAPGAWSQKTLTLSPSHLPLISVDDVQSSTGARNRSFDGSKLAHDGRSILETGERVSILQIEHEGLGEILACTGGCIIGNELLAKRTLHQSITTSLCSTTVLGKVVSTTSMQLSLPRLARLWIAVVVRCTKRLYKPRFAKELRICTVPRMSIFMANRIHQRRAWNMFDVRQIGW